MAYPEFICIDATYKLLNIGAPLYIILNEDGNGESCIIAVAVLIKEDKETLEWFLEKFKKCNSSWQQIQNIMSDKDFTERDVLRSVFFDAQLQICIFHVLKIFQREFTVDKYKISSNTKMELLELLQSLVYSKSEDRFEDNLQKIKNRFPNRIYEYLKENWVSIKEEWCPFISNKRNNFLNTTNNRLEGINAKIKAVCQKHRSLEQFLDELYLVITSLEKEKKGRIANWLNKRTPSNGLNDCQSKYYEFLTPYAFKKLEPQFAFKNNMTEQHDNFATTVASCTCYFSSSMGLPCKHIFVTRANFKLSLFETDLVSKR